MAEMHRNGSLQRFQLSVFSLPKGLLFYPKLKFNLVFVCALV